ncbi:Uncharacterised protein [Bordetella pertussis]|nr:Uncharacterised protein [Bordetella pertussis]
MAGQRGLDVVGDFAHGRTARVRGRDGDHAGIAVPADVAHHAEIHHRQHGDLRVGHAFQPGQHLAGRHPGQGVHHEAPG